MQMLQRLPIDLASNTYKNLLNKIHQVIYSLYRANQQYNDTIFMNSENSETFASLRLLLNLSDKINLTRSDK